MPKTITETLSMRKLVTKNRPRERGGGEALSRHNPDHSGLVLYHTKAEKKTNYRLLNSLIQKQKGKNNTTIRLAYDRKIIQYGNYFDLIEYSSSIYLYDSQRTYFEKTNTKTKRRQDSLSRTRNSVTRIIQCNIDDDPTQVPVFVTLTFKDNIKDVQTANYHFKKFTQRLKYHIGKSPKYLAVVEFQKRGAVHYHIVYFNLPYIDKSKFENIWSHGFSRIEVPQNIKDVTRYVGKYMQKELIDKRLVGQKAYFTSRGILRPIHTFDPDIIDRVLSSDRIILQDFYESMGLKIKKYKYA
jgi:hypothetical protein